MSQENSQQNQQMTMGQAMNIAYTVAHVWALPLEMILRRNFGRRYIDVWVFAAALWPLFFCTLFTPTFNSLWSGVAFWVILILGGLHRGHAESDKATKVHSQYDGYPRLCDWGWRDELHCKQYTETMISVLLAILGMVISPSLGVFIFGSRLAIALKLQFAEYSHREQLDDLRDAMYEQQSLGRGFKRTDNSQFFKETFRCQKQSLAPVTYRLWDV